MKEKLVGHIHCDQCYVQGKMTLVAKTTRAEAGRILRANVARQGWAQRGDVDLCPKCQKCQKKEIPQ